MRFDAAPLQAKRSPEGFLVGEARLTRTGIFVYKNPDGSERRELRSPAEVFNTDSLKSLAAAPMTLGHPTERLTTKNTKALAIGAVASPRADGRFIAAPFKLHDDAAIAEVEKGQRDISCGYDCDLDYTPGVFNGERYDAVQKNIRYNHVAIVPQGRAGPEVRIDADDGVCLWRTDGVDNPQQEKTMKKIRIDGVDFEVSEQAAQAFEKLEVKNADALKALQADLDKAKGRADALEAEAKKLKEDSSEDKIAKRVAARVALEGKVVKAMGAEFKCDGKSDDDLRREVIKKVTPKAELEGKSADYVLARFDTAMESLATKTNDANDAARNTITNADGTVADDAAEKARAKMIERNRTLPKIA